MPKVYDSETLERAAPVVIVGGDGTASFPSALGQTTKSGSMSVTIASDQFAAPVTFSGTLTVAASSHTAGDQVGALITLSDVVASNGGAGVIETVILVDEGEQDPAMELWFFKVAPTDDGDDGAFDPSWAELSNLACPPIAISGWVDAVGQDVAGRYVGMPFVCDASANDLYVALVTRETKTFEANSIKYAITISPV